MGEVHCLPLPARAHRGWLGCGGPPAPDPLPELSEPPSGLPLEYMVASLPSRMKRNQPLLPLESSNAAASLQM